MRWLATSLLATAWLLAAGATHAGMRAEAAPAGRSAMALAEARALLERAFANRYALDFSADIDLVMRNRRGQQRTRRFRALSKVIAGRTHSIGRLTAPDYLRGLTILTIEASARGHDSFVYLPSLDKVRRVSTAQRGDAFLGSDVTYADLERRRIGDYDVTAAELDRRDAETVAVIRARSLRGGGDERVEFVVAVSDAAILATHHFRAGATPHRSVELPREHMVERRGHVLPLRMEVSHRARDTQTLVVFRNLVVNPEIDARLFSVATLDRNRSLPGESD